MIEGRIPYGLGVIAGPNTIVAGSRAGIKFGFEVSSHKNSTGRSTAAERIALGTYGAEELQSMFGDSLASTTNRTTNFDTSGRTGQCEDTVVGNDDLLAQEESDDQFDETDPQYDDLREIITTASAQVCMHVCLYIVLPYPKRAVA